MKKQALEVETRGDMQNRRIYTLPNVKVEVVHPIENTEFCARCTRLRVTSDGKLKPCLMVNNNLTDVLTPMRKGATDEELKRLFVTAVKRRKPYYHPTRARTSVTRSVGSRTQDPNHMASLGPESSSPTSTD